MSPQVLILGLPRTGTQSIADALQVLGYDKVYHMREVGRNGHQNQWINLIEAKFGNTSSPIRHEDFEGILKDYDALADFPAAIFAVELMQAYPSAKVILSTRDEDAWYRSMTSTIWHAYTDPNANKSSPMRPLAESYNHYCWHDDFPKFGRDYFRAHNQQVKAKATSRSFLEFDVADGWQPLCEFLGKPVPQEPFVRSDDWLEYKKKHSKE